MSQKIKAYAAASKGEKLKPFEYDPGELRDEQVEIAVKYCGICHSDLAMLENHFGWTKYPFVGGHEVVGDVVAVGDHVKHVKVGQRVGLGWFSGSCMSCHQCMTGNHNLCTTIETTIVGRYGGFAERVRCHWAWAVPLPEHLDVAKAGPLFCGGITVFNPLVQFDIKPTDRVGVIGIGGLGHLALQFLNKWGCEVFAFTTSESKRDEAKKLGAHQVINSKDAAQMKQVAKSLDFLLMTADAAMDWNPFLGSLAPKGRLHFVGAVVAPLGILPVQLIGDQLAISGSPLGSPATTGLMLEFCGRHSIAPVTENFKMSQINEAFDHLRSGKARYRIVLQNDIS
jgi:uncharacterized zinc-type alcohol dehydrogenase-like protein